MDVQAKPRPAGEGVRSPRRKSELTRQRILEAAATIFRDKGYAHTRIADVAKEAETHAGAIYYYFASREELVEEVLVLASTRLLQAVKNELAKLPPDASYRQKVSAGIAAHLLHTLSRDVFTGAFSRIHNQISPELHDRYVSHLQDYGALWDGLLRDAQAAGEIRKDLDPSVMRLTLIGSMIWSLEWYREGRRTPEEIATQMSIAFFEGNGAHG
jgi:TetR/AcrR family transcriptional regulator, cholesterol catabolism regulator